MDFNDYPAATTGGSLGRLSTEQESSLALMHDTIMEQILSGQSPYGNDNMDDDDTPTNHNLRGLNDPMNYDSTFPSRDLLGDPERDGLNLHAQDQLPAVDEYIMNNMNMSMRGGMGNSSMRGLGMGRVGGVAGTVPSSNSSRGTGGRRGGFTRESSMRGMRTGRQSIIGISASLAGITPQSIAASSAQAKRQRRIRYVLSVLGAIGVCLSFMLIGVLIGKSENNNTVVVTPGGSTGGTIGTQTTAGQPNGGSTGNTPEGFERYDNAIELVQQLGYTTDPGAFSSTDTPQSKAAYWLATMDDLKIDITDSVQFRQRYVLAVMYYALAGANWTTSFKFLSALPECKWNQYWSTDTNQYTENRFGDDMDQFNVGVLCEKFSPYITRLYLPSAKLTGQLPNEIAMLTNLTELNLYNNEISGTLLSSYQSLSNLKALVLHQNEIHDVIPMWIGDTLHNLEIINLGDNNIIGTIPSNINQLSHLTTFNCESCLLGGTLDAFMNMPSLEVVHLGQNSLDGHITDDWVRSLSALKELDLGNNTLTGTLPELLFNNTNMVVIDLHGNEFLGEIPPVPSDNQLRSLDLSNNGLSGHIDILIGSLNPKIEHLDLSRNEFEGSGLPTTIGLLTDLKYLFLAFNPYLDREAIPTEIGYLKELIDISLQSTNRIGEIPYQLKENKFLISVDFINNNLSGDIPDEIGLLKQLRFLLLRGNQLTGDIPPTFSSLTELDTLLLDTNKNIDAGANYVCGTKSLRIFQADCRQFVSGCSCCTFCCDDNDTNEEECRTNQYYSNFDPTAEYFYVRKFYQFNEEDTIFPVLPLPKSELPLFFENSQGQHAIDNPLYGWNTLNGPFEYSPYGLQTEKAANPFEEYQEDKEYEGEQDGIDEEYYYEDPDKFGDVIDPWAVNETITVNDTMSGSENLQFFTPAPGGTN